MDSLSVNRIYRITKPRDTTTIGANLDYGIENDLKLSFQVSVGLRTDATAVTPEKPAPTGGISIVQVKPLGDTGLKYFWRGDFGAVFFRSVQESTNQVLERSRILRLSGAAGVLKRLETESGQVCTRFRLILYKILGDFRN